LTRFIGINASINRKAITKNNKSILCICEIPLIQNIFSNFI